MLGQDSVEQILVYYPEMTLQGDDGKEKTEYANKYFIMHKEAVDKKLMEREKLVKGIIMIRKTLRNVKLSTVWMLHSQDKSRSLVLNYCKCLVPEGYQQSRRGVSSKSQNIGRLVWN